MDNPLGWTREKLEEFAFGMKSKPITKTEPVEEIPDNLHLKINVATHFFTIQTRIKAVENDLVPVYIMKIHKKIRKKIMKLKINF